MGSVVAAHLATNRPINGLVLESSATTVRDWARGLIPWYARPFVRVQTSEVLARENNVARLQSYRGPLLLLVGENDRITPPRLSEVLYRASATPEADRVLILVPGAGHTGLLLENAAAAQRYLEFLRQTRSP